LKATSSKGRADNMEKLLKLEFRKLFHQRAFYICLAIIVIITVVQVCVTWNYRVNEDIDRVGYVQDSLINCGTTFDFTIILGVFAALFVSEDYSAGTIRIIVSRGFSRTAVYFSKLITLCCAALIMLLGCWLSAYISAKIVYDGAHAALNVMFLVIMLAQLLLILAYACLYNACAILAQKSGSAIAVCVVLPIIISVAITLLEKAFSEAELEASRYWLEYLLSALSIVSAEKDAIWDAFKCAPIYITVSVLSGWLLTYKREY